MLRINNRGFKKIYVYGGSGIFDTVASHLKRAATQAAQTAATQVGKKLAEKVLTPKSRDILNKHTTPRFFTSPLPHSKGELENLGSLTPKSRDILKKYGSQELNINALIDGSGRDIIRIEDYVKRLNKI